MEKQLPCCEEKEIHPELIAKATAELPSKDCVFALADLFKVFGDGTRLRILYVLSDTELCVCDIAELLEMTLSAISHQLRILKQAKLVKYRRAGKSIFYSLADDHVHTILTQGMEHISED